jgi:hypothetical protein
VVQPTGMDMGQKILDLKDFVAEGFRLIGLTDRLSFRRLPPRTAISACLSSQVARLLQIPFGRIGRRRLNFELSW